MKYLTPIILAFSFLTSFGQEEPINVSFYDLKNVSFVDTTDINNNLILIPKFTEKINSLDLKEVSVSGYLLQIDKQKNKYILSEKKKVNKKYYSLSEKSSWVNVIELDNFIEGTALPKNKFVTINGTFYLNKKTNGSLNYMVQNVKISE